ncbi:MAG: transposase, partial [Bacteriovoracaceae bacterium]|nr:transposase [Bacteriovoracaceae bacterium]
MKRFKRMIFGSKTEKTKKDKNNDDDDKPSDAGNSPKNKKAKKKNGNGRTSSAKYSVASDVDHKHESLSSGDSCPECNKGHLYNLSPSIIITFQGNQPITSKKNSVERLRCSGCGYVFTASAAEELRKNQYNESVSTALALMRYGMGLPSKRLEEFQKIMGVPISDSMQWKLLEDAASPIFPIYLSLKRFAANADLLHHDDTYLKILDLMKENKEMTAKQRKGMHTTAFVAVKDKIKASIFISGRNHAGENLLDILEERSSEKGKIITMSDALSRGMPKDLDAEICNCLSHARRKFIELIDMNISVRESKHMKKWLGVIYYNDTKAKEKNLTDHERLEYHQKFS